MTNMKLRLTSLFAVFFAVFIVQAQQLDPIHYPPESEWEYLKTKATDSLIQVMKYYFVSDDTLFFREALSQTVVKVAKNDLQTPQFYLGTTYYFANRFYGPGGETASRTSKNEKLDRFYYYYLNAPELRFSKEAPQKEASEVPSKAIDTIVPKPMPTPQRETQQQVLTSTGSFSSVKPHILMKSGCVFVPEKFYFLSDGQLYFGNGVRDNIYKVDTAAVAAVVGIEVGKNLELSSKVGYAFGGRCLRFVGIVLGAINVGIISSELSWSYSTGLGFFGTIPTGIIYARMIIKGTKRIQNQKRFKHARYAACN
ncbi:MAG: hypothetical protein ACK48O_09690 [Flavobacteriia bacterium]|jgi:hypothetical protein